MDKRIILVGILVMLCIGIAEALEIKSGTSEDLTIFLQNATTGALIVNSTCVLDVWLPNSTKTLDDGAMSELGEGFYYFSTLTNWTAAGNYRVLAKCTVGSDNYYSAMMFTVVATTVTEWFETINQTTSNTYDYLQNTIYPAVDTLETSMADVLANQTNLWNKLVEIQNNVTVNYNEIINTQSQLTDVNTSVMDELDDHKNRLININSTVVQILNNITQTINPKLDQLQTDIDLIKGYTDTLEAGQAAILGNISAIQSTVDTINTNTDQVEGYVDTIENLLDCNGSIDTPVCNKLDLLNTTINTINTNTDSLEAGQTTITNYVDTLETGQTNILSATSEIKEMLNCSILITSSVCWRLDLIQNYTDSLEAGQTTITNYVDTLETGQTGILANLSSIIGYVDTVESGIADLDSDIQNLNSAIDVRFDAIDSNLSAITTTVNEILSDQDSINASQTALLNQILTVTTSTNSTVLWIRDYLNGTITTYLENINATVTSTYNLLVQLNNTVNSIYSDTQSIISKWGTESASSIMNKLDSMDIKLDNISADTSNNSELLNAISTLESIVNSTRDELGFEGQSLTAYQYFVQLESELLSINTTLFNKIEFEHNATLNQILSAIHSNTTEIISQINANEVKIDDILTNWGSYTANDIINNVTANRNKLIDLENWLNAFNDTEFKRHNESKSLVNDVLAWLGIFNQSESERHNFTQTKIDNLFAEVNDTEELSNQIIAMLGYSGKNSTVYDDLILLYSQNQQIIALAQEINLTTHQNYDLLFTINETVSLIYSDTQDILNKWGIYNSSSIMDKLNIMDSKLDAINGSSNNSNVLNALADLESIVNSTRDEIGFEGQSLTAYQYFVQLESELLSINTTLFNKIEFEHNATVNQILSAIQSNTTSIINEIDANEAKLDNILNKWGSYTANDIINNVTANRNKLIDLENWLNTFNTTEELRHNQSKTFVQNVLNWLGIFNGTEAARHAQTQALLNNLFAEVNDTEELSNQIIAMLGYSGKSTTVFDDLANLTLKVEQIVVLTSEINLTTHSLEDKIDNQIIPKLDSIINDTSNVVSNWGNYTANDLYTKSLNIETKVDNMQAWLDSFNSTEQQRYADIIDEVNDTEELLNAIRSELGLQGESLTAYQYFVKLDSMIANVNSTLFVKIETENNLTRTQLLSAIQSNTTSIINEINANEAKLDSILAKWGSIDAQAIINNITDNRNRLISLQNWLNVFNETEANRSSDVQNYLQNVIFAEVNDTEELCSEIITSLGYSGKSSTVYDDITALNTQNNYITTLVEAINITTVNIDNGLSAVEATVDLIYNNTQDILNKWGNLTAQNIIDKLDTIETKVDNLNVSVGSITVNNTPVLNALADLESIVNSTRNEIGFAGMNSTIYDSLVDIGSDLVLVNTSIWTKIQTEHLTTRQQIEAAIVSNATAIISEVNANEGHLLSLLLKWGNVTADSIIDNVTENRNQIISLQSWLNLFNQTEEQRHNQSQGLVQNVLTWLGVFNETEEQRHNTTSNKLDQAMISIEEAKNLSNDIIAQLGYSGAAITVYDDMTTLMALVANITAATGNVTGIEYVVLDFGNNVLALPKQPSNTSIQAVMSNITGKYERVDHWNAAVQDWEVYVPGAPFGNTLDTMTTGEVYWIFTTEACILYIN